MTARQASALFFDPAPAHLCIYIYICTHVRMRHAVSLLVGQTLEAIYQVPGPNILPHALVNDLEEEHRPHITPSVAHSEPPFRHWEDPTTPQRHRMSFFFFLVTHSL